MVDSAVAHFVRMRKAKVDYEDPGLRLYTALSCSRLDSGIDVDGDGVPVLDIERKLSVCNGNGRSGARSTVLDTVDHIAILPGRETRLETRVPVLVRVIDRHKSSVSTPKRDALGSRRDPVRQPVRLNGVPESDHSGNGSPTMLADPPVSSTVSVASAVVPVRSALVVVTELVTGQDGGGAPWVSQDPNVSEGVDVVWRVYGQRRAVTFRIVVHNESVGGTARAGRVTVGFGVLKRRDPVLFECGLEGESVLEGLSLTESSVFSGVNASSSAVVDLQWIMVNGWEIYREIVDRVHTS